jgi:uncharacterized protein (TIGR03437 family)
MTRSLSVIASIFSLTMPAFAQKPILAWSARTGPDLQFISGTAVDRDGSIFVAARTANSTDPFNPTFRNSDIFVTKLSADGTTASCSMQFGGSLDDKPRAMALLPDGTVVVAGLTDSPDFPRVPNVAASGSDQARTFLARVDPCQGKILLSTYLRGQPFSLAVSPDGTVYAGVLPVGGGDAGSLERISATGSFLGTVPVRGIPYAVATDAAGSVYASGLGVPVVSNNVSTWKGFATKWSGDLNTIVYDTDIGEGSISLGTALITGADGTLYVAGMGTPPGANVVNFGYSESSGQPSFNASAAILFAVRTDGSVAFTQYAALVTPSVFYSQQRSVGVGLGPDGRIWMAITGPLNYPLNLDGSSVNGTQLKAFDLSGTPAGGDTLVGGLQTYGSPAAAFGPSGRISEAAFNRYLPTTAGSATSSAAAAISVVAFDLAGAAAAPLLAADRDILDIDDVRLQDSPYSRRDSKSINVFLSDGSSAAFTSGIVFGASYGVPPGLPAVPFIGSTGNQTLPGSISVSPTADPDPFTFSLPTALVILAPGAQGALTIPVRLRARNFSLALRQLDSYVFPLISSQSATFRLAISVDETSSYVDGTGLNLPFRLTSQSQRVTYDISEGTTPAQFNAIIDPTGLNPGTYSAQLSIDIGGSVQTRTISWVIVASIRLIVPGNSLDGRINPLWRVPSSKPSTQTITLDSVGSPTSFTVESQSSFLNVSPTEGQTPQDLTLTFKPAGIPANQTVQATFRITIPGQVRIVTIDYYVVSSPFLIPDGVLRDQAPGGLFTCFASTSRCDAVDTQPAPWPRTLGSCTIRVNGSPVPISSITSATSLGFEPEYLIAAQMPYDIPLGDVTLEIEDKNGSHSSLPVTVKATLPVWIGKTRFVLSPLRKPYDPVTVNFTGLGETDVPAPLGDIAASVIQPLVSVEAFVGGRSTRVLSAQVSSTAVGVFDITLEVPPLAPDLYNMILKIGGTEFAAGSVVVATSN